MLIIAPRRLYIAIIANVIFITIFLYVLYVNLRKGIP